MSYRVIDVFLSQGKAIERVSRFAADLAVRYNARLCAQYMDYLPNYGADPTGQIAALLPEVEEANRAIEAREKEAFHALAQRNGLRTEWRSAHSSNWRDTIALTHASDLIVMGQPDPDDALTVLGMEMASHILLQSGRPVLFLPYAMTAQWRFATVVVAWDGSRHAARAVADAMPFLAQAGEVVVLSASKEKESMKRLPDIDLGTYLADHDLKVKIIENSNPDIDAGNWLLSMAADLNADLLVMGGFGHNRFGEMLLGGATRTILKSMTLPVLMSH